MKLYTRTVCGKCMMVKSCLDEKGVSYEVINLDENEDELVRMRDKGIQAAPILEDNEGHLHVVLSEILAHVDRL